MDNPTTNPANISLFEHARISILTDRLIRFEWSPRTTFEDRATLTVSNRMTATVPVTVSEIDGVTTIDTGSVQITYRPDGKKFSKRNLNVRFSMDGAQGHWTPGMKDRRNLGGTIRTLDRCNGDHIERDGTFHKLDKTYGLISRDGWAVVDDSAGVALDPNLAEQPWVCPRDNEDGQDFYLMAFGHDYKAALKDGSLIFGRQPLLPRYALGYWYSRYWAYTDKELEKLVQQFEQFDLPLDVLVIDMDWHKIGWTGTSWCSNYFPDAPAMLQWLKKRHIKVSLNLHPADGIGEHEDGFKAAQRIIGAKKIAELKKKHGMSQEFKRHYLKFYSDNAKNFDYIPFDITDPTYMKAYFEALHRPMEADGVDVWWMDWQQGEHTAIPGLDTLPWINKLHWDDQAINPEKKHMRPICFSRFGGIGAGRYPIGFSGDTFSTWESLAYQPAFTAQSANVLYGTWSHDIGGHMGGENTPELYTRWMQFGIYSPIVRTHSSKEPQTDRRVFNYQAPYRDILMDLIRQRYDMIPYIYAAMRAGYESGESLVYPMYYDYPTCDEAYKATGQYMFGPDLLVAPIYKPLNQKNQQVQQSVWLPAGKWFDTAHGRLVDGDQWYSASYRLDEIPVFARAGAIIPGQTGARREEGGSYQHLTLTAYPGAAGRVEVYEDDGESLAYQNGKSAQISVDQKSKGRKRTITIAPADGRFKGFRNKRSLDLILPGSLPPKTVHIDGQTIPFTVDLDSASGDAWRYDGDSATTTVRLHSYAAKIGLSCEITSVNGLKQVNVNGLAGLFRRLNDLANEVALFSFWRTFFGDERFAIYVAQTGNRIGRKPNTTAKELTELTKNIAALPNNLRAYAASYRKHYPDAKTQAAKLRELSRLAQKIGADFMASSSKL